MKITSTETGVLTVPQRMPFHFGDLDRDDDLADGVGRRLVVAVETEIDGATATGMAMSGISGTWFVKGSAVPVSEGTEALLDVFAHSFDLAKGLSADTPFDLWLKVYRQVEDWAAGSPYPRLLWTYGVSTVEQAIVDAYCRHHAVSFGDAVRSNDLGIRLSAIHGALEGESVGELLPDSPRRTVRLRHTVGQTDPLTASEALDGLADGLPQTLEGYVREHGIDRFKIKLTADADVDAERLRRIEAVLEDCGCEAYAFTVDANEAYESAAAFRRQWTELTADPALESFMDRLLYVEQPLSRTEAFEDDTRAVFENWSERPPIIIDESDDALDSLPTALECGYAGTSHKNCKGVFKGIANKCLLEHHGREHPDREYVMSGEDLSTIGPIQLQQDLAVVATLGFDHVERNGHHYYRGLDTMPADLQSAVLSEHADLYRRHEDGYPTLDVRNGTLALDSVVEAPFGRAVEVDVDQLPGIEEM